MAVNYHFNIWSCYINSYVIKAVKKGMVSVKPC